MRDVAEKRWVIKRFRKSGREIRSNEKEREETPGTER